MQPGGCIMMNAMATDRIEKTLVLRAPVARVWQVLTNPGEFGAWFGVDLAGATFAPGGRARGPIQIEGSATSRSKSTSRK
jgi:uncharacterized protein YndB with AHSA1/START domain